MLDIQKIRADFPILSQKVNGKPLVYFDNGATSQKPKVVLDAITNYYEEINANIHRGVHTLSQLATDAYEASREKIRTHINAKFSHEVIFTSGTTHGINAIANGFASIVKEGDEVILPAYTYTATSSSPAQGLAFTDAFSGVLTRASGEPVNTYAINQGSLVIKNGATDVSSNYTITYNGTTFAITKRPITIDVTAGQSKVYGATDPAFAYSLPAIHPVA